MSSSSRREDLVRETTIRLNVAYISVVIVISAQFGGIVWFASAVQAQVVSNSARVDKLESELAEETRRTTPIVFDSKRINEQLQDLKIDVKEIKKAVQGQLIYDHPTKK